MRSPPKYIIELLTRLSDGGFESYLAGGCVRDMIMNVHPNDYDVATPARPEDVKKIFRRCHDTGLQHGTVTVVFRGRPVEVTTFRSDGEYAGHRRPSSVRFETDIMADLSRRDFTINAMALSRDGQLIDPFGGLEDITAGIIRCVGSPIKRFDEDALRMLRALRFSAVLGFEIEHETLAAISQAAGLAGLLSAERVRDELMKTLLSSQPERVGEMARLGLLAKYLPQDVGNLSELSRLSRLVKKPAVRLAGFLYHGKIPPEPLMGLMRFDNHLRKIVPAVVLMAGNMPEDDYALKTALIRHGEEALSIAAAIAPKRKATALRRILASGECIDLNNLALKGADLITHGIAPGREIGRILDRLLDHVLHHPEDNEREKLLKHIKTPPPE